MLFYFIWEQFRICKDKLDLQICETQGITMPILNQSLPNAISFREHTATNNFFSSAKHPCIFNDMFKNVFIFLAELQFSGMRDYNVCAVHLC